MVKAAAVDLCGWAFIGGALCHAVVRGDAAVQTAVEAVEPPLMRNGLCDTRIAPPTQGLRRSHLCWKINTLWPRAGRCGNDRLCDGRCGE